MGAERASSARDGRAKPQAVKKVSFRESESVLDVSKMEPGCPGERDNDTFVHGKVDKFRNYLIFLFPALGGFLFGYDIGATSSALPILEDPVFGGTSWGSLFSTLQLGLVVSASLFGALVGSLAAFLIKDRVGRKAELFAAASLYGVGSLLITGAPLYEVLVLGKFLYGLGIAFTMHSAPAYLAETGHPRVRGVLISMKEVFIVLGIEMGYIIALPCLQIIGGWRIVFGAALIPITIMLSGLVFLPESPRWLLLAGKPARALAAIQWARGKAGRDPAVLMAEFDDMREMSTDLGVPRGLFHIMQRRFVWPLLIGLSLMFFQQITGQPSVLYYATRMFEKAGISMGQQSTGIAGVLGAFKLAMTCMAVLAVDRVGRRPLLLFGVGGMCLSALAVGVEGLVAYESMIGTYIAVVALFLFVGCYQVSFGPISWLMVGEIFPLAVRGPAIALATLTNFGTNFVVALVLPSVEKAFGMGWLYTGFAIVTAVAWTVIYLIVLETKGKSLEEIEAFLMRKEVTPEGKPVSIFTRTRSFNKAGLVQRREKVSTAKRGAAV